MLIPSINSPISPDQDPSSTNIDGVARNIGKIFSTGDSSMSSSPEDNFLSFRTSSPSSINPMDFNPTLEMDADQITEKLVNLLSSLALTQTGKSASKEIVMGIANDILHEQLYYIEKRDVVGEILHNSLGISQLDESDFQTIINLHKIFQPPDSPSGYRNWTLDLPVQ